MKKTISKEILKKIGKALNMTVEDIEGYEPTQFISNDSQNKAPQEVFMQHLGFDDKNKVSSVQSETINTLQNLLKFYMEDFIKRAS